MHERIKVKRVPVGMLLGVLLFLGATSAGAAEVDQYVDVSAASGVAFDHQITQTILSFQDLNAAPADALTEVEIMSSRAEIISTWTTGAVAPGDYDGDGLPDLFVAGGDAGTARLYRNLGDGTFEDKAADAGVVITGERTAGAAFADYDGDGDLDLFVGGMIGTVPRLYRNDGPDLMGEVGFTDVFSTAFPGYDMGTSPNNWGGVFGDYDGDGDLDLFMVHAMTPSGPILDPVANGSTQHLWRNDGPSAFGEKGGDVTFTDVSDAAGISNIFIDRRDHTFAPNFVDLDGDGDLDLVIAGDIKDSLVLSNDGDGTFTDITNTDQFLSAVGHNGAMGAAVGDYDNDGNFDWFVSQIHFLAGEGNLLLRGQGDGTFVDVTDSTGVREGHWGWGACIADLDNDRHLDIFHVNGYYWDNNPASNDGLFTGNPAVAFIADGDGTFTERGAEIGLDDTGEGRGVSCFDFDRDGDIDVAVANHNGPFRLYKNTLRAPEARSVAENGGAASGFTTVRLRGRKPNTDGVGARVVLRSTNEADTGPAQLLRQVAVDGNFLSSNLIEAHFGLGDWQGPFEVEVTWLGGQQTVHPSVGLNSFPLIEQLELSPPSQLSFEEGALAGLVGSALGPVGEDRSADIEWSEGTVENVAGTGAYFDATGRSVGEYEIFMGARDVGGALTTAEPLTLTITAGVSALFADSFETGTTSRWSFSTH